MLNKRNLFKLIFILVFVPFFTFANSEVPTKIDNRVPKYFIDLFIDINAAFDAEDYDEAERLLGEIRSRQQQRVKDEKLNKIEWEQFYTAISESEYEIAKTLSEGLINSTQLTEFDKAKIYMALGNMYFENDKLDSALIEYKRILQFNIIKKETTE